MLKPTGSLYLFAGTHLATEVEGLIARRFNVLNNISWRKLSLHWAELIDHPIVFSHQGLNANKNPINPVFLRLVPNATQWKAQQFKRAFA